MVIDTHNIFFFVECTVNCHCEGYRLTLAILHCRRRLPVKLIRSPYLHYTALYVSDKIKCLFGLGSLTLDHTLPVETHLVGFKEPTQMDFDYTMPYISQWPVVDQTSVRWCRLGLWYISLYYSIFMFIYTKYLLPVKWILIQFCVVFLYITVTS